MPVRPCITPLLMLGALAVWTLVGCRDQPTAPEIGPSFAAVHGEGVPAPELRYYLAEGNLAVRWTWSDEQAWDLVSFELTLDGKKVKGDWNIKPYELVDPGVFPIQSYSWFRPDYGETVPGLCVSVMAKKRSEKGTAEVTYHAENCSPVLTPPPGAVNPNLLRPETVTSGAAFVCGLSLTGEAYCWGRNDFGQLGDGTTTARSTFWPVAGGLAFTQISAHGWSPSYNTYAGHACALTESGAAYCWGHNGNGQLGDGTTEDRHVPTAVAGGLQFHQIDVGLAYTCGVTTAGDAYCWGNNGFGQLGDGTTTHHSTPQPVSGGLTFKQISAGGMSLLFMEIHTCGVTITGEAYCWGSNESGQLGNGQSYLGPDYFPSPGLVLGGLSFQQISAGGSHSCGLALSGAAYCWGNGLEGQVGAGSFSSGYLSPAAVSGGLAFTRISAGETHTCALTTSGQAYCWGYNYEGELGIGSRNNAAVPSAVAGGLNYTMISAGLDHSCAVTTAGAAYCWGGKPSSDYYVTSPARTPPAALSIAHLSSGSQHACGFSPVGGAYCWGYNVDGQLGDGTTSDRTAAGPVAGVSTFAQVSAGFNHVCAVASGGAAYCWGWNFYGQLGDGTRTTSYTPVVVGGPAFEKISAGLYHTCGLTSAGAAYCWGNNEHGQLGDGSTTDRVTPVAVSGGHVFAELFTGDSHTCALTSSGAAHCWGNDGVIEHHVPFPVDGGLTFTQLSAGDRFTCGLSGGAAYCWGGNPTGQLGDGTTLNHPYPEPVSGGLAFTQLSTSASHVCAVTPVGKAYCWGWNYFGQLGDGTTTSRSAPVLVQGGPAFEKISAGYQFTCGKDSSGLVYCWGANDVGELGDGTTTARLSPGANVIASLIFRP